jgi:hypothetical protein
VHQDAGGVEHRLEAPRGAGQGREDRVHGVGGRDLAVPDALLHPLDGALDQAAPQPLARRGQLRVGEQKVGARHLPAGIAHRYAA